MRSVPGIATRRRFLQAAAILAGSAAVAACGAPAPTTAPEKPAEAPKPAATEAAAAKPADQSPASQAAAKPAAAGVSAPEVAGLKPVPRNRTLMHLYGGVQGKYPDYELWNPYAVGANHQTGPNV
jgi:peptide/nickel transport system substrate-binding protein